MDVVLFMRSAVLLACDLILRQIAAAWIGGQGLLHFQGDGVEGVIEAGGRYNEPLDR